MAFDFGKAGLAAATTGQAEWYGGLAKKLTPKQFQGSGSIPQFEVGKYTSDIQGPKLDDIKQVNPEAYKAQAIPDRLPEYDAIRNRLANRLLTAKKGGQEDIARQYAARGGLGSGSYQKALERSEQQYQEGLGESEANIGFQEAQQRRQLQEAEKGREFASGEAFKGREFQLPQFEFQKRIAAFDSQSKLRQLDIQGYQAEVQGAEAEYNRQLSQFQAQNSGGLFGGGGFLGLGL